jgi:primosomal protein N' (replication factor Y)
MDLLIDQQATIRELAEIAEVSQAVLRGMVTAGLLEAVTVDADRAYPRADPHHAQPELSDAQGAVAARLVAAVKARTFQPFLLDGVTGSGKTETYSEAIAAALEEGRQVLVLLPEIALTQSFLSRFEQRFGSPPVSWHSALKSSERRRAWRAVAQGRAQVVVGARSALFLPFANLGLIVVDEAHEISFKQDDGVRYNARDVAVMRARFEGVPVVLASATPALESLQMAASGRYERLVLPSRFGARNCQRSALSTCARTCPSAGAGWPPRWSKGCTSGLAGASRACCSSTGAALPR